MKPGVKIRYKLLLWSFTIIGLLPTWFLYNSLLYVIYFFFYRVFRYRINVVRRNLSNSFPEKTKKELRSIERKFYLHLAEVAVDTIDLVTISEKEMRKRIVFDDSYQAAHTKGRSWIAAIAHYGTWEYFSAYQLYTDKQVVGVYRPLHNEAFDLLYRKSRSRFGLEPVAMNDVLRYIIRSNREGREIGLGLIADQNPRRAEKPVWFDFLGQKTLFFGGVGKLAKKFNMPVYFQHTYKTGKIRYRAVMEEIYNGDDDIPEEEITRRYVAKLEQMIREHPQYWMWSHNRWKHLKWYKDQDKDSKND